MRQTELAVIDTSGDDLDQVTAIPDTVLRHNRVIDTGVCRSGLQSETFTKIRV